MLNMVGNWFNLTLRTRCTCANGIGGQDNEQNQMEKKTN